MATFYHPQAKPSNPGADVDVRGAGFNGVRLECIELEVTAAQLVATNTFNFAKYNANTVILGGWVEFDDLDSGTPAFEFDIGLKDGTTTDPDALLNSGVISGGGGVNVALTSGIGTTAVTNLAMAADYDVYGTVTAAPATAVAGTIKLCLLLADRSSVNAAAVS